MFSQLQAFMFLDERLLLLINLIVVLLKFIDIIISRNISKVKKLGRANNLKSSKLIITSSMSSPSTSSPEKQAEQVDWILAGREDDHGGVIVDMTN